MIPSNKLQSRLQDHHQDILASGPYSTMRAPARILKVYDQETLDEDGVALEVGDKVYAFTGLLFAKVELMNSQAQYILPFDLTADYIYLVHGNRVMLEGANATVLYHNQDIQNGRIILRANHSDIKLGLDALAQVYDVGFII